MEKICIYPGCIMESKLNVRGFPDKDGLWCERHFGLYPHECEDPVCDRRVVFDDEPKCFTHSPDSGSSVAGYSAYRKAQGLA